VGYEHGGVLLCQIHKVDGARMASLESIVRERALGGVAMYSDCSTDGPGSLPVLFCCHLDVSQCMVVLHQMCMVQEMISVSTDWMLTTACCRRLWWSAYPAEQQASGVPSVMKGPLQGMPGLSSLSPTWHVSATR
jgi:hypothetical protein